MRKEAGPGSHSNAMPGCDAASRPKVSKQATGQSRQQLKLSWRRNVWTGAPGAGPEIITSRRSWPTRGTRWRKWLIAGSSGMEDHRAEPGSRWMESALESWIEHYAKPRVTRLDGEGCHCSGEAGHRCGRRDIERGVIPGEARWLMAAI